MDFVIEDPARAGRWCGIKAAASVSTGDLVGLKKLATLAGKQFFAGVVLYDGNDTLPMGERLWAVPLSILWAPFNDRRRAAQTPKMDASPHRKRPPR